MTTAYPYIIHHLYLENDQDNFLPHFDKDGHYLVFWWKSIPIGELYLPAGTNISENVLRKKILKAIDPAVEMYMSGKPPRTGNFKKAFLNKDHDSFREGMNEIFSAFIPHMVPPSSDVSVIICTRNKSGHLKRCLESLNRQKCMPLEIIVVDNAPVDDSVMQVINSFKSIRYHVEARGGLGIARNSGAGIARGSIIAYTDDDVEMHPYWIYQVNETFIRTNAVAMTGLVIASELKTESQQIFEKHWSFNRGYTDKVYDREFLENHRSSGPPVWEIGAGMNMAFRKKIFRDAGSFDERFEIESGGCNGDSEMWYRILAKGGSINYNPRAIVFHQHRNDLPSLKKQLFNYMSGFATAALIQQSHHSGAGYKKHLYLQLPYHYAGLIIKGFPLYRSRYSTIFNELKGVVSGIRYYHKNKKKKS